MNVEKLLGIATDLLYEDWSYGPSGRQTKNVSDTVIKELANAFRYFEQEGQSGDRIKQAIGFFEKLGNSPFARGGMRAQYQRVLRVLQIRNGKLEHPLLKWLDFEDLSFLFNWFIRMYKSSDTVMVVSKEKKKKDQEYIDERWGKLKGYKA